MQDTTQVISQIREFNRFYTVLLGLLDRNYLDSEYSVTETRILFEFRQHPRMSANRLIDTLRLDKSYISRLIRSFEQKGLLTRCVSPNDKRALLIELTPKGEAEADRLIGITNESIGRLIEPLCPEARVNLCAAMRTIIESFPDPVHEQEETYGHPK